MPLLDPLLPPLHQRLDDVLVAPPHGRHDRRENLMWIEISFHFNLDWYAQYCTLLKSTVNVYSCLSDVDDDGEREGDADDGEEDAEDAARRRHRRDVAITCNGVGGPS